MEAYFLHSTNDTRDRSSEIEQLLAKYKAAMADTMPAGSCPSYAGKAFSCKAICRIMAETWLEECDFDAVRGTEAFRRIQKSLE